MRRVGSVLLWLTLLAVLLGLAAAPVLFGTGAGLDVAARICVMIVLAASLDLMLGQARIVSFVHMLFFAMGAYGVALASLHMGPEPDTLIAGALAGAAGAGMLALVIGWLSRRAGAPQVAMFTFVVAATAAGLVGQFPSVTGGAEGLAVAVPAPLSASALHGTIPAVTLGGRAIDAVPVTGRIAAYYLVAGGALGLVVLMLGLVRAPFVRRLQAGFEDGPRPAGTGRAMRRARLALAVAAAVIAALAGALFAVWMGQVAPDTTLGFDLMLALLLMVLIGGMGTVCGAVLGAALVVLAQTWFQSLSASLPPAIADLPVLPALLMPERWPFWVGMALVLGAAMVPTGITGLLRGRRV